MSSKDDAALVDRHLAAENDHRLDDTLATLRPARVFEDVATGPVFEGRDGAARYCGLWWDAFDLEVLGRRRHWGEAAMLAVIIEYQLNDGVETEFRAALQWMLAKVEDIDGYLGETALQGLGDPATFVTISYWRDHDALERWRDHPDHVAIKARGRTEFFKRYRIRIAEIGRDWSFPRT